MLNYIKNQWKSLFSDENKPLDVTKDNDSVLIFIKPEPILTEEETIKKNIEREESYKAAVLKLKELKSEWPISPPMRYSDFVASCMIDDSTSQVYIFTTMEDWKEKFQLTFKNLFNYSGPIYNLLKLKYSTETPGIAHINFLIFTDKGFLLQKKTSEHQKEEGNTEEYSNIAYFDHDNKIIKSVMDIQGNKTLPFIEGKEVKNIYEFS